MQAPNHIGYPEIEFTKSLKLFSDDNEGGASAVCFQCNSKIDLEESEEYIVEPLQNICHCNNEQLSLCVGLAFHSASTGVRWVYIEGHLLPTGSTWANPKG